MARDISATVIPIGVKLYVMAEMHPRTSFSPFVRAISLGVAKCGAKKGARVDHFWPLRHRFLPFDREYLGNRATVSRRVTR